jgi:hypothetical protein
MPWRPTLRVSGGGDWVCAVKEEKRKREKRKQNTTKK